MSLRRSALRFGDVCGYPQEKRAFTQHAIAFLETASAGLRKITTATSVQQWHASCVIAPARTTLEYKAKSEFVQNQNLVNDSGTKERGYLQRPAKHRL